MTFRTLIEGKILTAQEVISAVVKNKHNAKNARVYDDELYFEMKDVQGAIRLSNKLGKSVGYGEISNVAGGQVGFYELAEKAILGNNDAVAYMKIVILGGISDEHRKLAKATEITQSTYETNLKQYQGMR